MGERKVLLQVVKSDGTVEGYLHTKVMGTINSALAEVYQAEICVAEELAEVVTYYLYNKMGRATVRSEEIFSVVKGILSGVGFDDAAEILAEHQLQRRLKRNRVEVVYGRANVFDGAKRANISSGKARWDKGRIVSDLLAEYDVDFQTARVIAGLVEEKVFNMGLSVVSSSLIKQLVLNEAAIVLEAQRQLESV